VKGLRPHPLCIRRGRGCGWGTNGRSGVRAAWRHGSVPSLLSTHVGFRMVLDIPKERK